MCISLCIVEAVRLVAPFFDDFRLQPSRLNPEKIQLEWQHIGSDRYFNAHSFSDGTLRFICLATLLLQPELPATILLDEPELGLHPYAVSILAEMIQSAATKTQIIVSTQSVTLVNQFQLEDIVVIERENEQSHFKKLKNEKMTHWLDKDFILEISRLNAW
ncbi:MAG: AAA family ATPase [Pseudomonadota bacterium]